VSRESSSRQAIELESQRTASWVSRTTERWILVQPRGLEQRASDVVDDRLPLVGGVAVRVAVELERPVAAVKGVGRVGLGGVEKLSPELVLDAVWERVEEVHGDAERGGGRDRGRQERDRTLGDGIRGLAEQEPTVGVGRHVADGEFLVGPGAPEMAVGPAEVDHSGSAA
jgi:hypothetical protein